jgi:hypothetical protein
MDPNKPESDPNDVSHMMEGVNAAFGPVLEWPRKPMGGRAIGAKKGGKTQAKGQGKGRPSHRAMRSSKSHPPKKYQRSPIGWE